MRDVIQCKRVEVDSDLAIALITELNAELSAVYPEEGANHFRLDKAETQPGNGAFIIAFDGDVPLGCGAVRRRLAAPPFYINGFYYY